MTTPFEVLFSITVYRDGQIRVSGRPARGTYAEALPAVLRTIAEAIEAGAVLLTEEESPHSDH